jgi:hypothetical protein
LQRRASDYRRPQLGSRTRPRALRKISAVVTLCPMRLLISDTICRRALTRLINVIHGLTSTVQSSTNARPMSALGQKQTSRRLQPMSALPPKADIGTHRLSVRFVPKADSCTAAKKRRIRSPRRRGRAVKARPMMMGRVMVAPPTAAQGKLQGLMVARDMALLATVAMCQEGHDMSSAAPWQRNCELSLSRGTTSWSIGQ